MRSLFFACLLVLVAGPAAAHEARLADLVIVHPWARATAGAAKTGAVYMKIENGGDHADRLVSASAAIADKAELHNHIMENGVAKMRRVEAIDLAPGAAAELKPGGLHVMLIGLHRRLKEYDTFTLTLTFEHAGQAEVEVYVEEAGAAESSH